MKPAGPVVVLALIAVVVVLVVHDSGVDVTPWDLEPGPVIQGVLLNTDDPLTLTFRPVLAEMVPELQGLEAE